MPICPVPPEGHPVCLCGWGQPLSNYSLPKAKGDMANEASVTGARGSQPQGAYPVAAQHGRTVVPVMAGHAAQALGSPGWA